MERADLGKEWIKQLQQWWDVHAYYPKEAADKNESGTVKLHLLIHQNGLVWIVKVVQSSGSEILDKAGHDVFLDALLRPFPQGTSAPEADIFLSVHYVLTQRRK